MDSSSVSSYADQPILDSSALTSADRAKLGRTVLLVEQLIRAKETQKRPRVNSLRPLSPGEACGHCGTASELGEYLLLAQGMAAGNVMQKETFSAIGEGAFPHVFLVYKATGIDGQPVTVIFDPSFSQVEAFSFLNGDFVKGGHTPGQALARDPIGRAILQQIRTEGYWIPTKESFEVWQRALSVDPKTGEPAKEFAMTWEQFLAQSKDLLWDFSKEMAWYVDLPRDSKVEEVLARTRELLAQITPSQISERMIKGACRFFLGALSL